jgi:peptide/nickel transport system permease protein
MSRTRFVVARSAQALLVIALSYTLVFFTLFVLPGNPIENKLTNPQNPLPDEAAGPLIAYYHLDKSPIEQFLISVERLFRGDWGYSLTNGKPVTELIGQGLSNSAPLAALALLLTAVLSLGIALLAVFGPRRLRGFARLLPLVFLSTPSFLVGFLLLLVFSFQLGWISSIRDEGFVSLILPALTLAIGVNAPITQVLITGLDRAAGEPFVTVLRARGVSEPGIVGGHLLKNGSIPAVTLLALTVGDLLASTVVVETVFSRTGIGFITQQAVRDQDTPVILAVVVLVSTTFVLINLAADLVYPLLDPRIDYATRRSRIRAARRTRRTSTGVFA